VDRLGCLLVDLGQGRRTRLQTSFTNVILLELAAQNESIKGFDR